MVEVFSDEGLFMLLLLLHFVQREFQMNFFNEFFSMEVGRKKSFNLWHLGDR